MTPPDDRVIVFDLDDTLYLERDFVRSGLAAAGGWMRQRHGIADFAERAEAVFDRGERGHVFDVVLAEYCLGDRQALVATLVAIYRSHMPEIALAPDAAAWLQRHRHGRRLALLTDGPAITQSNKVHALGLDNGGISPIVCTGQWGRGYWKPHRRGYDHIEAHWHVPGAACVYVADNPAKDFMTARALGWQTIQIVRPGAIHATLDTSKGVTGDAAPDAVITSLDELDDCLAMPAAAHHPDARDH